MMTFKPALELATLQKAGRQVLTIDEQKILFIWHNHQVYAIQAQCPHLRLPLAKGMISNENTITCPFHKSEFDLCSGEVKCWSTWPPIVGSLLGKVSKQKKLKIYPTQIADGQIMIQLTDID